MLIIWIKDKYYYVWILKFFKLVDIKYFKIYFICILYFEILRLCLDRRVENKTCKRKRKKKKNGK